MKRVHVQGHRGARGLRPENTLPSFEAALDAGVTSIETDVHLTADGVPVLCHEPMLTATLFRRASDCPDAPLIAGITLAELRALAADRNPDPLRFPDQDAAVTPLAAKFAQERKLAPYAVPTLSDLFAFAQAYAGPAGTAAGKSRRQRLKASRVIFDLELKRVPFHPETIGDVVLHGKAGLFEKKVADVIAATALAERTVVRSFDHRSVLAMKKLCDGITGAILVSGTTPLAPWTLARAARAEIYAPDYHFVDPDLLAACRAKKLTVIPWTVNATADWEKLLAWGVAGITTDYPDRLVHWLGQRRMEVA